MLVPIKNLSVILIFCRNSYQFPRIFEVHELNLICNTFLVCHKTGKQILKLLQDMSRKENMTVIIITHNGAIAPMADKVIKFKNGTAEDMIINENPTPIEEIEW